MPTNFYSSSADTTWSNWNNEYQMTSTATTVTAADTVWYTGCNDTSTCDTTWSQWVTVPQVDNTWTQWVTVPNTGTITYQSYGPQLTPEEVAAQNERFASEQARIREAADKKQAERLEAVKKAKALLNSLLDEKQREQLERQRFFEFVSQTGKKMRMKRGIGGNIDELDAEGKRIRTLCAHPAHCHELVEEDHMASQLLTLRYDEETFLRVANVSNQRM